MKRTWLITGILFLAVLAWGSNSVSAENFVHVTGGGTGTFDGTNPGSQFGMGVLIALGGSAQGSFNCVMAGRSAFGDLHLMKVNGKVDSGTVGSGTATFSGSGTLHVNNLKDDVTFVVTVIHDGGPGVGQFQLTVSGIDIAAFPAVVAFPPETVFSGQVKIH